MEDSKKYFKLQVEFPKVNGTPISVDSNQSPEKRIEDLTSAYKVEYVRGKNPHYVLFEQAYWIPRDTIASSPQASITDTLTLIPIGKDSREPLLKAIIDAEGNLKVIESKKKIFTTQIDKNQAYKMVEDIKNWKLMQMWI